MFENLHLSWKMIVAAVAVFCVLRFMARKNGDQKASFSGRVGGHLITHAMLSAISGVFGINVVIAVGSILLAIPLMMIGVKVDFPDYIKDVPRGWVSKVTTTFLDKKAAVTEKVREEKDAVAAAFHENKEQVIGKKGREEPVPMPEGGVVEILAKDRVAILVSPPDSLTVQEIEEEVEAFRRISYGERLSMLDAAEKLEGPLPDSLTGNPYIPIDRELYKVQLGEHVSLVLVSEDMETLRVGFLRGLEEERQEEERREAAAKVRGAVKERVSQGVRNARDKATGAVIRSVFTR